MAFGSKLLMGCALTQATLLSFGMTARAEPAQPASIVVTAKRALRPCSPKDQGCIQSVVKEVWTRYPNQVATMCEGWQMAATTRKNNLEAYLGDSSNPLQAISGETADDALPPPESAICNHKPETGPYRAVVESWLPWSAVPSEADLTAAYPAAASADDSGDARIYCGVNGQGHLIRCSLSDEYPAKKGFGKAAMGLVDKFRVKIDPSATSALADWKVDIAVHLANPKRVAPRLVEVLDWTRLPDPDVTARLYPAEAIKSGVASGVGKVDCRIGEDGVLGDCRTVEESPAGLGFAAAALAVAPQMRANLWTRDGQRAAGARVILPLRFDAPAAGTPPQGD